jgi:Omp85 superfamily domain
MNKPRCLLIIGILLATASWAVTPEEDPTHAPPQGPIPPPTAPEPTGIARWFNPATAPFIPIPEIGIDPNSGTTLGVIPTWVKINDDHEITRIIAPDVIYNENFGVGAHGRVYGYESGDEQWSVVAGIKQRVERDFDAEYQLGRLREQRWSINTSVVYDRDGTTRFFGIGNESLESNESNYTSEQERAQIQVGFNLTHAWQLQYTGRVQVIDVQPGTLSKVPSIETVFGPGTLGTDHLVLNRLGIVYDTRDNLTVPNRGVEVITYAGLASRNGFLNDSLYSEAGGDGRGFWPVGWDTVLVGHAAIRYLLTAHDLPFWALSSVGGGESELGGAQPLRGFGSGRFYDRDYFAASFEARHKLMTVDFTSTAVDVEVSPFVDVGRVFAHSSTMPLEHLHPVAGLGFRFIARPFVVGYVDIGYGSEGVAAFTGLNYPF